MKAGWQVHFALLSIGVIHGANYSIAKIAMPQYIQPYAFILLRLAPAACIYGLLWWKYGHQNVARKHWPVLILCGFFGAAFNQLTFFKGLSLTTPINAALIMILVPVFTMILASFILREKITLKKIIGIILGLTGAAYIIFNGSAAVQQLIFSKGDFLVFLNALSYAFFLVLIKPLTKKYHPLTILFWTFTFGCLISLPFGWQEMQSVQWSQMPISALLAIAYVIVFTTCVTYLLNAYAMVHASATLVSAYIFVQPIFATLFASMWGSDTISIRKLLAGSFIFAGVLMVSYPFSKPTKH